MTDGFDRHSNRSDSFAELLGLEPGDRHPYAPPVEELEEIDRMRQEDEEKTDNEADEAR